LLRGGRRVLVVFFFPSRRRHMRWPRDWSSDVCSSDLEYLDWGPGRNWETAIARELPAYVDAHYRTVPGRAGRALIGVSAGGYGEIGRASCRVSREDGGGAGRWQREDEATARARNGVCD